ncbi:MAG: hypothetical protein EKK46_06750 [Rhodocyclaceae bacterium]|nr:MAG: hypothetical protein EKK46_06750 [Rhodocyclaceae bacterium]
MPENVTVDELKFVAAVAGATGAVVAAVIAGVFALIGNWMNKRSEERKHLLDLCSKMATENLMRDLETAKATNAKTGKSVPVAPIDAYFIHMLTLIKAVRSSGSQQKMIEEWQRTHSTTRAAVEQAIQEDAERKK